MARILYGVMGDAGGHLSRSLAVAQQLREHEIVFVGGGRVPSLRRRGYSVIEVPTLGTSLRDGRVSPLATVRQAAAALAQRPSALARLKGLIREYDPHLIVTDYEYFLPQAARQIGHPCVSLDRQHALTLCRYDPPRGHRISRLLTVSIMQALHSAATRYLVCSFTALEPLDPRRTEVVPPVLRREVFDFSPRDDEHVVVYLRGFSRAWISGLLRGRGRRYVIYGFDEDREEGNLLFRRQSSEGFLADLSGCAYAVSNAGHNVICEALHFGKPVLCFPVGLFYEQLVNAHLLAEAGLGAFHDGRSGAAAAVDAFEAGLSGYRERVALRPAGCPHAAAARLEAMLGAASQTGRCDKSPSASDFSS